MTERWPSDALANVFNEGSPASDHGNSITSSDLDPFLLQGDDQTWAVEDWNWDPFNMFAAPKEVPNVACCQALKKRKVDNTATSAQQPACQPCHGSGAGHRSGPPAAAAAACCSVAAAHAQPVVAAAEPLKADLSSVMPSRVAASAACHAPGMLAPPPPVPVAAPMAAVGPQMGGMGLGMGMPTGFPGGMGWPGMPGMPGMGSIFPGMAGGGGPFAAMGWGAQPMALQMPMPMAQCGPALSVQPPVFPAPSGVFNQQASAVVPPSAMPSPALGSDSTSLQGSADNGQAPFCGGNHHGSGPTCSGGRQQADSSNKGGNFPAPAREQQLPKTGTNGGDFVAAGDISDFASDSDDDEGARRGQRAGHSAVPPQHPLAGLHHLADVVALQEVADDSSMVCQVPGCGKDLTNLKEYHQRYRICDVHIKLQQVMKDGRLQRFCQQCGRFHDLTAFDGNRKSCREQLSKHNARRRRRAQVESAKGKAAANEAAAASAAAAAAAAAAAVGSAAGFDGDVGKLLTSLMSNPTHLHALRLLLGVPTHPALPAAQAAGGATADPGNDASNSDQARTYGLARDILAGRNEFTPAFESEHRMVRLSMKLFNKTPADLPADLRNQVTSWLASAPSAMEASIRPGCVFLTVQMLVDEAGAAQAEAPGALTGLAHHLLTRTGSPFWHNGMCTLQLGNDIVLLRDGKLEGNPAAGRGDGRFPEIRRLGPFAAVAGQPVVLKIHGQNLDAPGCAVILRWGMRHLKAHLQPLSSHRAIARLPPLPDICGPVWVEVARGAYLSPAKQLLVARDEALVEEINRLDVRNGPLSGETVDLLLQDLALVLQHIAGDVGVAAQLPHTTISLKARRLLAMACDMGWAAVASAVLPLACARCSCAAEMVAAIHAASVPTTPAGGAAAAAAASSAAGADTRGLTLLHRAVRSGSIPLLAGMLAWGDSHGYRWRVDAAGPAGITPLHLSAMLDDARMTLLLLDHSGWPAAFTHMKSDGGVTPFHLAFQMGHYQVDSLMAALGGLHQVVDRANNAASAGAHMPPSRRSRCGANAAAAFKVDDEEDAKPAGARGAKQHHKDCCSELDPCELCHCTLPPLLLSINATCNECGRRRMCMEAEICRGGRGCGCGGSRPNLRSDLGEVCNTSGHSTVFSITALCQGCHGNRVLAVA